MAAVDLRGLSKAFGLVKVLHDVSVDIGDGEFAVLLGPSGCGKTTLLRLIAGLETLSDGEIRIGDERIDQLQPGQRGIAMVFQSYALYPHMSVRANLAYGLKNIGTPANVIAQRIDQAATILEIEQLLDRKPHQLSGGQRQRVAIGRAITKSPKVFLFDEPLSNLDAALRARTRVEISKLHQQLGATMIFVTHDQVEAMTMASKIVVMNAGRVEQVGPPLEVYRHPATRFVAAFIGTPQMNFVPVNQTSENGGWLQATLKDGARLDTRIATSAGHASPVELGFRPDEVAVDPDGALKIEVEVVERLGDRTLVYAHLSDGTPIIYQDHSDSQVQRGDRVGLRPHLHKLIGFDGSGKALHPELAA
ncbi:ABC transporter ATP-binding protein [Devosia nitrariae]|uniref:ABC transporter ATP-binding protein n=1 Tax=Devosia nitrariae TaxID=2071872 RepID=A0ABQ5W5G6_9HYPH|nr:sn-glycerol-3-phosphate ABC transporter ATP-binding protein UgpC [Devosia nitrariae]GLQ55099.1 ABC transporter ATP-binding protein [Devosia nitrariae]